MRRVVENCCGCGVRPCLFCTTEEYICDLCASECDALYEWKDKEVCRECLLEEALLT